MPRRFESPQGQYALNAAESAIQAEQSLVVMTGADSHDKVGDAGLKPLAGQAIAGVRHPLPKTVRVWKQFDR